jgi:hypothetical protein
MWNSRWDPLNHKVGEGLTLDGMAWRKLKVELHKVSSHIRAAEDGFKRICSHHLNLMGLEVVLQLTRDNKHCVKQLLDHRVPCLGLIEVFTDEVD